VKEPKCPKHQNYKTINVLQKELANTKSRSTKRSHHPDDTRDFHICSHQFNWWSLQKEKSHKETYISKKVS